MVLVDSLKESYVGEDAINLFSRHTLGEEDTERWLEAQRFLNKYIKEMYEGDIEGIIRDFERDRIDALHKVVIHYGSSKLGVKPN